MLYFRKAGSSRISNIITSIFPIYGLQIIPESCQTPHIIHHWKEDDISDDKDNDKDKYEDKDKDKYKMLKRPITCYIFLKQFKDIKYDTNSDHKYKDKYKYKDKDKDKMTKSPNKCYNFENDMTQGY